MFSISLATVRRVFAKLIQQAPNKGDFDEPTEQGLIICPLADEAQDTLEFYGDQAQSSADDKKENRPAEDQNPPVNQTVKSLKSYLKSAQKIVGAKKAPKKATVVTVDADDE